MEIPTSWEDITIGKYIELKPILETEQTEVERVINILCVLTGKKREEIREIQLKDYHKLIKKMSFLNTEIPTKLEKTRFKIDGKYYEFKINAEKLMFGEYINAMELLQSKNENAIFDNLHKILVSICRPVERRLRWREIEMTGELLKETSQIFYDKMSITIAYPILVFFAVTQRT